MENKKGFTLVEIIVVIAIIAILSLILIPQIVGFIDDTNDSVDRANLRMLNTATQAYTVFEKKTFDFFDALESDEARMNELVTYNHLSEALEARNSDNTFVWIEESDVWQLQNSDGEIESLTEFGNTFSEIHSGLTDYIEEKFLDENFKFGRIKDPTEDDLELLGLDPDVWLSDDIPFGFLFWNDRMLVYPKDGYDMVLETATGEEYTLEEDSYIVYDFRGHLSGVWREKYFTHLGKKINPDTVRLIEKTD